MDSATFPLELALQRWRQGLVIGGRSPLTLRAYDNDVAAICESLARQVNCTESELKVEHLSGPLIRAAFAEYASSHAPSSVARCRSTWTGVLDALVADGVIGGSPIGVIPRPSVPRRVPKPLRGWDEGTVDELLIAASSGRRSGRESNRWKERDEALVDLLVTLGPRRAEVCGLDIGDYTGTTGEKRILIRGKGNKERVLPVPTPTALALDRYLTSRRARFERWTPSFSDPLFVGSPRAVEHSEAVSTGGKRISAAQVTYVVERIMADYGLSGKKPKGALVHALRHTFGTQIVDSGVTLSEAADIMGHASTSTTRGYTEVTGGAKRDALEHSPAASSLTKIQRDRATPARRSDLSGHSEN